MPLNLTPEDEAVLFKALYHMVTKARPVYGHMGNPVRYDVPVREFERVRAKILRGVQQ
jgi:hypothetical protein